MSPKQIDSDASDVEDAPTTTPNEDELTSTTVTKYQAAADIANRALSKVIEGIVDGAIVSDLCALGDSKIEEFAKAVYNKPKGIQKGIAFPTCVSPRNIICHLSPIDIDEESKIVLKTGDMVRIELGAHVDGYIAQVAHTVVIGASKENPITGRQADALQAAYLSLEAAIRLLKPGKTSVEVAEAVQKVADEFECKPVEGMVSHQVSRNKLDGEKQIVLNPPEQTRKEVETFTFEEGEVYSLDILVSSSKEGKAKLMDTRTTVFKRTEETYLLKMKTSRMVLSEINSKFGNMAFSLRHFADEKKARMGITECQTHGLLTPYKVLHEKEDTAAVAHLMFTVLLMPNGPLKITAFPWDQDLVKPDHEVKSEEIKDLLKSSVRSNKNKKKKAAKKAKDDEE